MDTGPPAGSGGCSNMPVVVPGHHNQPVGIITGEKRCEELSLASAPQHLDGIREAAVPPSAHICDLLQHICSTADSYAWPCLPAMQYCI